MFWFSALKHDKSSKEINKDDELDKKDETPASDDDEFNVSLAKMEEEIKPKIVNILGGYGYQPSLATMEACIASAEKGIIVK